MSQTEGKMDIVMFLASSVHDMKNSLNLMAQTLERQIGQMPPEASKQESAHLLYEIKRINANLIHLLTLYKLNNELYPFDSTPVLVEDVFHDLELQNRTLLASRGITLQTSIPDDLVWHFDVDLINGVLGHAINNAINYTRDTIYLTAVEHGNELELRVEDNGRGYPPSMLLDSRRGLSGVDFHRGSTGLGLYFASHVAQMHRNRDYIGSIRLENGGSLGGGCFILTLP